MCPLRFILVFFSAILAGYFAWRTVRSSPETDIMDSDVSTAEKISSKDKQEFHLKQMILNGFWGFVDMASGRITDMASYFLQILGCRIVDFIEISQILHKPEANKSERKCNSRSPTL
ncbi:hypothetical protein Vadar_030259 [Vaccinium darrowii]|uniref:Uncharacterized protein n=1 Tax=Vaccinium darrowii TaxID=229202 RepID=A0ACB7XUF5_9ERIC|nr:hypothetical protein Vadar_030259 [Vaccinium darrowii]